MTRIGITGGTGFVGSALIDRLGTEKRAVVQLKRTSVSNDVPQWQITTPLDVIIHSAARVHVMRETSADPLALFRQSNVEGTLRLARQAAIQGVKRFVFVSSVKVNGEFTLGKPFGPFDLASPTDSYGISKFEAEQGLLRLAKETAMEVVIVRPPLVYGPGVKANFFRLMQLVQKGTPLPLASVKNRRSMVAIDNLVDLLIVCAEHPDAANQIFMVSDDQDLSVSELWIMLAHAMHKPSRLFSLPIGWIRLCARLLGQSSTIDRLFGALQVDITHTKKTLGWKPIVSVQDAIQRTAIHFCKHT